MHTPTSELLTDTQSMPDSNERNESTPRRRFLQFAGATAGVTTLSGCSLLNQDEMEFSATPYGLDPEGRQAFGFREVSQETVETTVSGEAAGVDANVTLTSHVAAYGFDAGTPNAVSWAVPADDSWSAAVISTPEPDIGGQQINPLSQTPVTELLTGESGGQFREALSLDADWECGPERLNEERGRMLGRDAEFQIHTGVLGGDGRTGVAVYSSRVQAEGDTVIFGAVNRRRIPQDAGVGSACLTPQRPQDPEGDAPELPEQRLAVSEQIAEILELARRIRNRAALGGSDGTDDSNYFESLPDVSVSSARLVQKVEQSSLSGSGNALSDPPIVADQPTAVLFDLTGSNLQKLDKKGVKVWVLVGRTGSTYQRRLTFWIRRGDLIDIATGDSTAAKFHQMARTADSDTDPPIFSVDPTSVTVRVTKPNGLGGFDTMDSVNKPVSNTTTLSTPLRVGFIHVEDPGATHSPRFTRREARQKNKNYTTDIDWGDANGEAANYDRSVRSSFEYLKRVFPGDIVAYKHPKKDPVVGVISENWTNLWDNGAGKDAWQARQTLNKIRTRPNFPRSDGEILTTGGISRQNAVDLIDADTGGAFDVRVMILPKGTGGSNRANYFAAHSMGASGYHWGFKFAVGSLEALPRGDDISHATTTAQEIGHRFALPLYAGAFRRGGSDDLHANASLRSVGYDLTDRFTLITNPGVPDGSFSVDPPQSSRGALAPKRYPSYMSYAGGDKWADSKVHRYLANGGFSAGYSGGSNPNISTGTGTGAADLSPQVDDTGREVQPVIEALALAVDGDLQFDTVVVRDTIPRDAGGETVETERTEETRSVEVNLLGPRTQQLVTATVPDRLHGSHGDRPHSYVGISLPFRESGVSLVAERAGATASLNAITGPVRDAVGRVPAEGLRGGEETRERLRTGLDDVATAMDMDQYGAAATALGGRVRGQIADSVGEYDGSAADPSRADLLRLVDRLTRRLEAIAEGVG
jgi:hypothetical protein